MSKTARILAFAVGFLFYSVAISNVWAQNTNFVKVSLEPITTRATSEAYINPPIGDVVLGGTPFFIHPTHNMAVPPGGGNELSIPANVPNTTKIFVLINSYNTWSNYNNQKVGDIKLEFSDGSVFTKDVIVGVNIREWREGNDISPTVNWVTDPSSTEVFRGNPTHLAPPAVMDMLTIDLPINFAGKTLTKVAILDISANDPGILWMGLTIQQGSGEVPTPFLDLPWDYQEKGLSFTDAALAINSYFDHEYPLLSSGISEPIDVINDVINFRGPPRRKVYYSSHDGYDYGKAAKANIGDSVLAAAAGVATLGDKNKCGPCGNYILIDHGNGYQTRYFHLEDGSPIVQPGQSLIVKQDQQIGKIGATGHVEPPGPLGAHIHFMVVQDKNGDGNFDDNIPDGMTDPFGWQSTETDPWPNYSFNYTGQDRTGNSSFYLWTKAIANLSDQLTANGGFFELERYKLNFPQGATDQNLNLEIQAEPNNKPSNFLESIGSTIKVTAKDLFGNVVDTFQDFFTVTVDFNSSDISAYDPNSFAIYSSEDGISWTKEETIIDLNEKTASAQLNHLSYFALMAERLDTIAPTTTAILTGDQGQTGWFRSNVQVNLNTQDNPDGLGVDYTLYKINDEDWQQYSSPLTFKNEGNYKIEFYSVDKDENIEDVKSIQFNIDKIPPEAKIFIDQDLNDLVVIGLDQNQTTITRSDNPETKKKDDAIYTITDQAGNTLKLDVRDRDKEKEDRFKIYSLIYNQEPQINLIDNHYNVSYQGNKSKLNVKEQNFEIEGEMKIRIKYDRKKDQSTIITKEASMEKVKEIKTGVILLLLNTNNGKLEYGY